MKKPYVRAPAPQQPGALSNVMKRLESGCTEALMAPFVAMKRDCANFSQASYCWEMYSESTGDMTCLLTLAKTSESPKSTHLPPPPPPTHPTPTPQTLYGRTSHPGVLSNLYMAPNTQEPFDEAD